MDESMFELASLLRAKVGVRDRAYHFRVYENCFIGSDAVQWLLDSGHARDETEAVNIGKKLVRFGMIHHVVEEHDFENKYLFYRFSIDEPKRFDMLWQRSPLNWTIHPHVYLNSLVINSSAVDSFADAFEKQNHLALIQLLRDCAIEAQKRVNDTNDWMLAKGKSNADWTVYHRSDGHVLGALTVSQLSLSPKEAIRPLLTMESRKMWTPRCAGSVIVQHLGAERLQREGNGLQFAIDVTGAASSTYKCPRARVVSVASAADSSDDSRSAIKTPATPKELHTVKLFKTASRVAPGSVEEKEEELLHQRVQRFFLRKKSRQKKPSFSSSPGKPPSLTPPLTPPLQRRGMLQEGAPRSMSTTSLEAMGHRQSSESTEEDGLPPSYGVNPAAIELIDSEWCEDLSSGPSTLGTNIPLEFQQSQRQVSETQEAKETEVHMLTTGVPRLVYYSTKPIGLLSRPREFLVIQNHVELPGNIWVLFEVSVIHRHIPTHSGLRGEIMAQAFVAEPLPDHPGACRFSILSQFDYKGRLPGWMSGKLLDMNSYKLLRKIQAYLATPQSLRLKKRSECAKPKSLVPERRTYSRPTRASLLETEMESDEEGDLPSELEAPLEEVEEEEGGGESEMTGATEVEAGSEQATKEEEEGGSKPRFQRFPSIPMARDVDDNGLPVETEQPVPAEPPSSLEESKEENQEFTHSSAGLADFEILAVLGHGGYGKVLQVRHLGSGKIFAMKVLKKNKLKSVRHVTRTKIERDILSHVRSPFIVGLQFAFQTAHKLYMVMEFVPGGDMFSMLSRERSGVGVARTQLYIAEVLLALEQLHAKGVVYRDLKPENVLIDRDGHAKLTDFGLSRVLIEKQVPQVAVDGRDDLNLGSESPPATASDQPYGSAQDSQVITYSFCGTEQYMAPEVLLQKGHSYCVDYWSLGILMSELLTGRHPFRGPSHFETLKRVVQPSVAPNTLSLMPPAAADLCARLLVKDPDRRLGSTRMGGAATVKSHPFFQGLDWDRLARKDVIPSYKPAIASDSDVSNFDTVFTNEAPEDSRVSVATTLEEAGEGKGIGSKLFGWLKKKKKPAKDDGFYIRGFSFAAPQ